MWACVLPVTVAQLAHLLMLMTLNILQYSYLSNHGASTPPTYLADKLYGASKCSLSV